MDNQIIIPFSFFLLLITFLIIGSLNIIGIMQNYENKKLLERSQSQKILSVHITDGEKHLIIPPFPTLKIGEDRDFLWEDLPNLYIEYAHDTKTLYIRLCLENEVSQ